MDKIINQINSDIMTFFKEELPGKYNSAEYPFFDEDDLVSEVHDFLKDRTIGTEIKVYREYPVHMIAPLRLTDAAYKNLNSPDRDLSEYYHRKTSGYFEIKKSYEELINDNPFQGIELKNGKKYNRVYEPKYFDLVVIMDYNQDEPDELIVPEIVMEFKYEAGKNRLGNDLRKNLTLPKNNNPEPIKHDLNALEFYCKSNPSTTGYFVFLDESAGKNIENLLPVKASDKDMQFVLPSDCAGKIVVRTF